MIKTRPRVDGDRLWRSLMELARIGATPKGGVARLALTDLDREARDWVIARAANMDMAVTIDRIGNIFMRRPGRDARRPAVMSGSHIDTQPTGGKFDGNYGVLAALEVVRTLNEHAIETDAPVEVAVWTNEEGSRFVPVMMGSGVFCGAFGLDSAYAARDVGGRSVRDELERIGYLGDETPGLHPLACYFEAHIEQGPVLENAATVIGVVDGALGLRWYDCTVTGTEAHAGSTPMTARRDALAAATRVMQEVVALGNRNAPHGRGTVGYVSVFPNSRNVIPGEVRFSIDLRNASAEALDRMDGELRAFIDRARRETGLTVDVQQVAHYPACPFDPGCVGVVRRTAERLGYSHMNVTSGAGHDAIYVARVAPAAMIFVPCKEGISHNEIEDADPAHLEAGANVLLHCVLEQAGVAAATQPIRS
jgi:beta-ureidopropionase / N-carbamoyl-L-amino-acid hydrolase